MKYNGLTLGVLGGMGPAASAEFMRLLSAKAPAARDQEHPKVILYSMPQIPDRTEAILCGGADPTPILRDGLSKLVSWGADRVCVTCNTAHYFIDRFRGEIGVPLIHIVEETIRCCRERNPQGAWLTATTGTMQAGIFQQHAAESGYRFRVPDEATKQEIHSLILQVKAGELEAAEKRYRAVCEALWAIEKLPVAEACTELPIAYAAAGLPQELGVSSLEALADGCLRELYQPLK